jgi:RNA polymerase sigma factor (sigma-70 family)
MKWCTQSNRSKGIPRRVKPRIERELNRGRAHVRINHWDHRDELQRKSDAQLVDAWNAGDRRAGGELSKRYLPMLLRFVRHKVSDPNAAKDVVGCALLQLCKSLHSLKDPAQFRAFVMGIAWNTLKSHYRKHSQDRLQFIGDERLDRTHPALEDRGIQSPERPEHAGRLVHALRCLPIEDQQLLMACYVEGMSYGQLATAFDLESGTVASRLSTAKARLAVTMRTLENEDEAPADDARDFTNWAVQLRRGIEAPSLAAILPRRLGRWRLIEFERASDDSIRSVYRQWPLRPAIELEIAGKASQPVGVDHRNIWIGERSWMLQFGHVGGEYVMQVMLREGRMLRLVHRPASEWSQVTRFAARLDVDAIERSALPEDAGFIRAAQELGPWAA